MSDNKDLEDRVNELEREKLQKRVRELEAQLKEKQDKQKKISLRRIDLTLTATLLIIVFVIGIAYLFRDEVSSLASRIKLPGAPTSTPQVTPTMAFIGGCSAAELQSPEVQAYLTAVNEELANSDVTKIEVFLASVQTAYDNLPACVQNYVEPFNTPLSLGLTAAAQARDEVDPASMQNYRDIMSGHMQEVNANISFFNGLQVAYTNPSWVKGATATTGPGSTPATGPGLQAGGGGSTLKIYDTSLSACYYTPTKESYVDTISLWAEGGSPYRNYTWSAIGGLPMGTTLWPLTGVFTSNGGSLDPSKPEQTVQLEVSDGTSTATATVTFRIHLTEISNGIPEPCPEPVPSFGQRISISSFALEDAQANKPYGASIPIYGGTPPYSFYLDTSYSGRGDFNLSGLTLDQSSGIVWGTPFNSASGKTLMFRVIVKDSAGLTAGPGTIYTISVK